MTNKHIKKIIGDLLPPVVLRKCYDLSLGFRFKGNYSSWEEARKFGIGYDSDIVLDRVKKSMLKVKNGEYAFARDSVLFDSIQHSFPVLAGLLRAALANNGELSVVDFGGSLGSSYYQCRNFLEGVNKLTWSVVEHPKFAVCGKQLFENNELKFYQNLDECCKNGKPNVILLSSVIQYIEKPYSLLEDIKKHNFEYIIFDRTSFLRKGSDRLAIQKVPKNISEGGFPIWFFNYDNFLKKLLPEYELVAAFDTVDKVAEPLFYKGFILKRKCKL